MGRGVVRAQLTKRGKRIDIARCIAGRKGVRPNNGEFVLLETMCIMSRGLEDITERKLNVRKIVTPQNQTTPPTLPQYDQALLCACILKSSHCDARFQETEDLRLSHLELFG